MFASIRWQARPGWGRLPDGVFRISVPMCQPPVRRTGHGRQLACHLHVRRALASTCLRAGKWPCGLNSRRINHLQNTAQVKHIIGAKPVSHRPGNPVAPAASGAPAVRMIGVDADSAGQRLDNFLLRHLKGVPKTHVYRIIRSCEASGILLVAKKRSALTHLQDQFRERETGKTYLALVLGAWPANKKVIDTPLHKYLQADGERDRKSVV